MPRVLISKPITYSGFVLEGGWKLDVPEIKVNTSHQRFVDICRVYQRLGVRAIDARGLAEKNCERFWRSNWAREAKRSVARLAKIYAEERGSLEGFDPERVAGLWMPVQSNMLWSRKEVQEILEELRYG